MVWRALLYFDRLGPPGFLLENLWVERRKGVPMQCDFEATFVPLYPRVFRVVQRLLGDREAALEATQEAYLKAYQQRTAFREQARAVTWICQIAVRVSLDRLRRRKRWWQRLPRLWSERTQPGFENRLADQDLGQRLALALPEKERCVLVLRSVAQLSYEEIARALDMPVNQVGVYLQRARNRALKHLDEMEKPWP